LEVNRAFKNLENLELSCFWSSYGAADWDSSLFGHDTTSIGAKLPVDMASYRGGLECYIGTI